MSSTPSPTAGSPDVLNILHLAARCSADRHVGGVSKVVFELARTQSQLGNRVVVASFTPSGARHESHVGAMTLEHFPTRRNAPGLAPFEMYRYLVRRRPTFDVVHVHSPFTSITMVGAAIARRHGSGLFYQPHGAFDPLLIDGRGLKALKKRGFLRLAEDRLIRSANGVVAVTETERKWLADRGFHHLHLIPNGISPIDSCASRSKPADTSRVRILYLGRITTKKRLELVIQSLPYVIRHQGDVELLVAGSRDTRDKYVRSLDEQVANLGLDRHVRWLGFVDEDRKPELLSNADIFVLPSESEGLPVAALEAMSAGLACLVTPGAMLSEAAKFGAAIESSETGFGDALLRLVLDRSLRASLGAAGQSYVEQYHNWEKIARRSLRIYQESAVG